MGQFMVKQSGNGGIGEQNLVLEYQKDCDTSYVVVHNSDLQILDSSSPRCGATSNGFKVNVASLICMVTWSMIRCLQLKTKNYRKVYLCLAIFCASLLSIFGLSAFLSASIGKRKDIPWIEQHICCSDHVGLSINIFFFRIVMGNIRERIFWPGMPKLGIPSLWWFEKVQRLMPGDAWLFSFQLQRPNNKLCAEGM